MINYNGITVKTKNDINRWCSVTLTKLWWFFFEISFKVMQSYLCATIKIGFDGLTKNINRGYGLLIIRKVGIYF